MIPALQSEEFNNFFEKLPKSIQSSLWLHAHVSQGKKLVDIQPHIEDSHQRTKNRKSQIEEIITGIQATYFKEDDEKGNKKGDLDDLKREGSKEIKDREEIEKSYTPPFIVVYGANRYKGDDNSTKQTLKDSIEDRLIDCELYDVEEILINLHHLASIDSKENDRFNEFKRFVAQILPGIEAKGIHIVPCKPTKRSKKLLCVLFDTFSGPVPLSDLSLGYQSTLAWTFDLAWRLYENYPESPTPLEEPAIVLIDELDLHLHPKWQLRIMDDLTKVFPNVQFIATSHSPLLVQSKPSANFAVIKKGETEVVIENEPELVKGWRIDQILNSEYFGVEPNRSLETEELFEKRDELLLKLNRNPQEEKELQKLQQQISRLRSETNHEDDKAMDLIRRAAELLKSSNLTKK